MGALLGPAGRSWRAATALLVVVVLLLTLAVIWLPRIRFPFATADHRTWELFGRTAGSRGCSAIRESAVPTGRTRWFATRSSSRIATAGCGLSLEAAPPRRLT